MRIYMDVCCWCRPFDEPLNERIGLEAQAVLAITMRCQTCKWELFSSPIIDLELEGMHESEKKRRVLELYSYAARQAIVTQETQSLARRFQRCGIKHKDSIHLAAAECNGADVFLTVDDKLIRAAQRQGLRTAVQNPVFWIKGGYK